MATILVVEDEPTIRVVICTVLGRSHECHAVRTGEEGLELLAERAFDAAVTDVKLPGINGGEFLRRALVLRPSLPVIVMSGGYGYDEREYLDAGAFGYLLKPFDVADLEAVVKRAVSVVKSLPVGTLLDRVFYSDIISHHPPGGR